MKMGPMQLEQLNNVTVVKEGSVEKFQPRIKYLSDHLLLNCCIIIIRCFIGHRSRISLAEEHKNCEMDSGDKECFC